MNNSGLYNILKDALKISNNNEKPANIKIGNPDIFLATYLSDKYTKIDNTLKDLIQEILRNIGRKVLKLYIPGLPRYISRITFVDRLNIPHNDILELMKVISGQVKCQLQNKIRKINFNLLIKDYQKSQFVIHDQCISEGTTTLDLYNILKTYNIKLIGTDIAMYYYLLTTLPNMDTDSHPTKSNDELNINNDIKKTVESGNFYSDAAAFDHFGNLTQLKYNGVLTFYHPLPRKIKAFKKLTSNLIHKIQYNKFKVHNQNLFKKMKPLLMSGSDKVTRDGYTLYRKKFLNPQTHYYPEIVFKEHNITEPFSEQSSIMVIFNSLKLGYFEESQIKKTIPLICNSLKECGLLFIGEGEFDDISYTVFQKFGNELKFIYKVNKGADIEKMIIDYF